MTNSSQPKQKLEGVFVLERQSLESSVKGGHSVDLLLGCKAHLVCLFWAPTSELSPSGTKPAAGGQSCSPPPAASGAL